MASIRNFDLFSRFNNVKIVCRINFYDAISDFPRLRGFNIKALKVISACRRRRRSFVLLQDVCPSLRRLNDIKHLCVGKPEDYLPLLAPLQTFLKSISR